MPVKTGQRGLPGFRNAQLQLGDHVRVLSNFTPGSYRFLAATGRPFSAGIVADPGFDLVHAVFSSPLPLEDGLKAARGHVESAGRPATALAAFELRIPKALSREDFNAFNAPYVERMAALGLKSGPEWVAARTNVAPTIPRATEPSLYAFSYTVPRGVRSGPAFRLSGATEARRHGSAADRLRSIIEELQDRMVEMGVSWEDATAVNVYGAVSAPIKEVAGGVGSAPLHGLTWFPSLPPITDFEFEIDARAVGTEIVL